MKKVLPYTGKRDRLKQTATHMTAMVLRGLLLAVAVPLAMAARAAGRFPYGES